MPLKAPPRTRSPHEEGTELNEYLRQYVVGALIGGLMGYGDRTSTTELDSHANMAVVGKDVTVILDSRLHAEVRSFSNDVPMLQKISMVDAVVAYDDPCSMKTYLLVIRNALQVGSMEHNLILPFLLREARL